MSQQKRVVKVYRSSTGSIDRYESDAVFFGQLRNELRLDPEKETITVQETKVTLFHDEAHLPEGDFLIFVSQKKSKSGATIRAFDGNMIEQIPTDQIESQTYNELRSYCKKLTGIAPPKKDQIIDEILKHYNLGGKPEPVAKKEKKEKTKNKKAKVLFESKKEGFSFPPELEARLGNIQRGLFEIAKGLNQFIEEEGAEPIDVSFLMEGVEDLPIEVKNTKILTEEEKKILAEKEENERIKREAKSLGY